MNRFILIIVAAAAAFAMLGALRTSPAAASEPLSPDAPNGLATAVVAGGCFWCVESDFEKLSGVISAVSGYTGGLSENPSYHSHEGHVEAVQITYDPAVVTYRALVDYHLRHIDPFDADGQFCDRGHAYTTAIYAANGDEWADAKDAISDAEAILGRKIVTPIIDRTAFWRAEGYHQDYYKKNPLRYKYYRKSCGRDARVEKIWRSQPH